MKEFSKEFQAKMVTKLLLPDGPTVLQLSQESGVSKSALYKWLNHYRKTRDSAKDMVVSTEDAAVSEFSNKTRPQNWSAEEKFKAIVETEPMTEEDIGIYCRKKGIYSHNLVTWKKAIIDGLKPSCNKEYRAESQKLQKEIKVLTKDLNRKDKALAETSALLILKKKANLIWGEAKDDI